ncbi:MAG: LysE family transporter [Armatimonadota bacterium]|nr:LysE family transporter [Armatimonadota bacterium]
MDPGAGGLTAVVLTWWIVSLSGVLMPGPVSAMAVSGGARRGLVAGPLITAGHAAAEICMVGALVVGLSQVLQRPAVVGAIGLLGGAVLLPMGWSVVQTARRAPSGPSAVGASAQQDGSLVRAGMLTTVANPYWYLWWATVGAAYLVAFRPYGIAAVIVLFLAGHLALDLGWNSLLALVVGARRGRVPARVYQVVLGICGAFVMVMSGYFVYSGITFLLSTTQR